MTIYKWEELAVGMKVFFLNDDFAHDREVVISEATEKQVIVSVTDSARWKINKRDYGRKVLGSDVSAIKLLSLLRRTHELRQDALRIQERISVFNLSINDLESRMNINVDKDLDVGVRYDWWFLRQILEQSGGGRS